MSVRKVKSKDGEVRWEICVYTNGRGSKRLKRRFDKKVDADQVLEEYHSRQKDLDRVGTDARDFEETTFKDEAQYWLERQGLRFSPGHKRRVEGILKEILPSFGSLAPNRLTPDRLSLFQSEQLGGGLTPATVNRKTDVMTAILNFSVEHRRLAYSPAAGFKKLAEVREDMKFWERQDAEAFLDFADRKYPAGDGNRWRYVVYLLAINTALRAGEIWGLWPSDLVQGGELLHIRRQWDLNVAGDDKFRPPKGKKSRYVPCNEQLCLELQRLIAARTWPVSGKMALFHTRNGTPISHDNFDDDFRRDVKQAGLKEIRFHDLRHTGTTLMLAEGLDIKTVQEICGHKDVSTTMKYVHLLGDSIRRAAKVFSVRPKAATVLQLVKGSSDEFGEARNVVTQR